MMTAVELPTTMFIRASQIDFGLEDAMTFLVC